MKIVEIKGDYITLGKFLKYVGLINNGGEAKLFLLKEEVFVNKDLEARRGRKLKEKDVITINNKSYEVRTNAP